MCYDLMTIIIGSVITERRQKMERLLVITHAVEQFACAMVRFGTLRNRDRGIWGNR